MHTVNTSLLLNEWDKRSGLTMTTSLTSGRSSKKVLVCLLLVGPPSHALVFITTQGWRTHQNVFRASQAPSATNQAHSYAKSVPETPTQRKEPKNVSSVKRTPSFQVGLVFASR